MCVCLYDYVFGQAAWKRQHKRWPPCTLFFINFATGHKAPVILCTNDGEREGAIQREHEYTRQLNKRVTNMKKLKQKIKRRSIKIYVNTFETERYERNMATSNRLLCKYSHSDQLNFLFCLSAVLSFFLNTVVLSKCNMLVIDLKSVTHAFIMQRKMFSTLFVLL